MKNEALLEEIRSNFDYAVSYWREIRSEGAIDMRYIAGDPWEPEERKAREKVGRPCIALDELNQYTNQLINDVRRNKRAIKVVPEGAGATDKTAEFRANLIRQIEYKSNAQAAYTTAFEGATQRSYGFARISKQRKRKSFDQELVIRRIANPDTVYIDPDCKEADCSDMDWAFIVEPYTRAKFIKRWPKAEIKSFSSEMITEHPLWVQAESIQVAEYWRREYTTRTLLAIEDGNPSGTLVYLDELPKGTTVDGEKCVLPWGQRFKLLESGEEEDIKVVQYITNGLEILEKTPWDGRYVPVGAMFGKELYVDDGGGSKRKLLSLIRLARDPYMLYCYYRTCEMELAGMTPKVPAIGYEGQFEGHEDEWNDAHRTPIAFLQAKAVTDATGATVLPLPQWNRWEPPIQALEMGAEASRRAIQSAVGMFNTSVGRHDTNAQSGVAIKALDAQSSQGSFHFIDAYDGFLAHMGRMLDELIETTYDTEREVGVRKADEEHEVVRINKQYVDPKTKQEVHYPTNVGEHGVTITTGPSYDSQREEAAAFTETLAQNQALFPRIADLVVKLRNLGPIGDEIAKRLTPPDIAQQQQGGGQIPPQVQQMLEQGKQAMMQQAQIIEKLQEELRTKAVESDGRLKIAEMQEETKRMNIQATIRIAELNAGVQTAIARLEQEVQAIQHSIDTAEARESRAQAADQAAQQRDADQQAAQQQAQAQPQAEPQAA